MTSKKRRRFRKKGISLIENLLSMTLFLFIVMGVLEVFSLNQNHFMEIKISQETNLAACSALDKMKADIQQCGKGFEEFNLLELAAPLSAVSNILTLRRVEEKIPILAALSAGQTWISLENSLGMTTGMEAILSDGKNGEIHIISSVDTSGITLSTPLHNSYAAGTSILFLLYKLSFYLDESKSVLRRKVNSSPAQPLCEEVDAFECSYLAASNLVQARLALRKNPEEFYDMSVFPKNMALCAAK